MLAADMPGDLFLLFCLMLRCFCLFFGFFSLVFLISWMPKPEQVGGGHSRQSPQPTFYIYKSPSCFLANRKGVFFSVVVVEKTGK